MALAVGESMLSATPSIPLPLLLLRGDSCQGGVRAWPEGTDWKAVIWMLPAPPLGACSKEEIFKLPHRVA